MSTNDRHLRSQGTRIHSRDDASSARRGRPSYAVGTHGEGHGPIGPVPDAEGAGKLRTRPVSTDPLTGIPKTDHGRIDPAQIIAGLLEEIDNYRASGLYDAVPAGIRQIWDDVEREARGPAVRVEDTIDHLGRLAKILERQERISS